MDPSQFYRVAAKRIPQKILHNIYGPKSGRTFRGWAADRYCETRNRTPLERLRMTIEEMDLAGYGDYARAAIDYLAEPLDGHFADNEPARSDKGTIEGEIVDATVTSGRLADHARQSVADGVLDAEEKVRLKDFYRNML